MNSDFAIIGAGIAGASLAARLAAHGSVLLAERESQPGFHSTGRSAAMFMASYGTPQVRALTRASRAFYAQPPAGFADAPILSPRGVLYVAWQGQQDLLARQADDLAASGCAALRLDAASTLARVPVLRSAGLVGAIAEEGAMDIDVHALHHGWLAAARRLGTTLWLGAALASARHRGGRWQLRFADGRSASTRVLVNAAGAWADVVAQDAGIAALGLQPRRRSAFTFDAPAGPESAGHRGWPLVAAIDEGWYFKPDAGLLLGSPANADPVPAHDVLPEEIDIATGIARIEAATQLRIRRPRRTWAGLRTFAADGDLVVGFEPGADGFFWLAGQGGYGIQTAAAVAALAESLLLGSAVPGALQHEGVLPAAMAPGRLRR